MPEKPQPFRPRPPRGTPEYGQYLRDWAEFKRSPAYAEYLAERQRRIDAARPKVPEPTPEMLATPLDRLEAELAELGKQQDAIQARRKQLAKAVRQLHTEDHAAGHGLTAGQYDAMKTRAKAEGLDFATALRQARKDAVRGVQVASTTPAAIGVKGAR